MQEQLANIMKTGRYKLIEIQKLQLHGNRASINEAYSTILLGCLAFVCNQGCPLGIFTWLRNHNRTSASMTTVIDTRRRPWAYCLRV